MATLEQVLTVAQITESTPGLTDARRTEMLTDAWSLALIIAPCIGSPTFSAIEQLRAVLRRAIAYDAQTAGGKVISSQTVGPLSIGYSVNKPTAVLFSPTQEALLKSLCAGQASSGIYSIQLSR